MWQRLENSWELVKSSAEVLNQDRELLLFPALSAIAVVVVSASFFVPVALTGVVGGQGTLVNVGWAAWVVGFLFYLVHYTVIFFFNSALVGAAMIRLEGGDPTLKDGLRIAWERIGPILGYAAIAATVGLLLKAAKDRSKGLGRFVASLLGIAWSLATYLVVPVLVTRDVGPIDAIKESSRILKRTWGEQVAGNLGLGVVFWLVYLGLAMLLVPLVVLAFMSGSAIVIIACLGVAVLIFALTALVQTALSGIYSAAVYRFATTGEAKGFEQNKLQAAFEPR